MREGIHTILQMSLSGSLSLSLYVCRSSSNLLSLFLYLIWSYSVVRFPKSNFTDANEWVRVVGEMVSSVIESQQNPADLKNEQFQVSLSLSLFQYLFQLLSFNPNPFFSLSLSFSFPSHLSTLPSFIISSPFSLAFSPHSKATGPPSSASYQRSTHTSTPPPFLPPSPHTSTLIHAGKWKSSAR